MTPCCPGIPISAPFARGVHGGIRDIRINHSQSGLDHVAAVIDFGEAIERNRELRPFGRRVMTRTVGEHITAPPTVLAGDDDPGFAAPQLLAYDTGPDGDQSLAATRVTLRPHDPATGEEIDKREVVKGYEYARGEFVTFTAEELKALDVESSKVIDLEKFVPRNDIDPVYFDSSYYLHPDGPIAVETLRVIGAAMAEAGVVGLGRLTLSRRERMVVVEPRGTGMALFTLRAASDVRPPQFGSAEGDLDAEMVAIAGAIIRQRTGHFDPSTYRDRYQEALQQLIEAKTTSASERIV